MDQKFPSLQHGQVVRAVGEWQPEEEMLRSYSVRLASKGEESTVEQCVTETDRQMRRMAQRL
jgi:hypothetical protein